ncbi:kinase superfamily with octicosapeptide/Phox/Bem1p domain-containing protein [Actinidia rufa]|uniref:Kinase superfamily with octicosapeptide/Phox/Bem1p domain-containing protein n=1 Tax=Actinidia rufa TaxID=165716 RepID=A0A7J0DXJ2_9ERIC|nr:kinase superfamily with octicosapeptide/Phox/Bem1p domain-containing protein [Actinidia rufa]
MERNMGRGMMEQHKTYEQVPYNSVETRNEGLGSANQRFFQDPSSSVNTNARPPDLGIPVNTRPVLNYSIQTGEEFALEFMRERVNSRQHFIPNPSGDSNSATSYTDLKGILGISHTGSESGSDLSLISSMDKGRIQESERRGSSIPEDKGFYQSMQSVPQTLSRNGSSRGGHAYASSDVSDTSSAKVKFLCSFGGKILPRPSDGKLRYVGGETRIIRISKGISWQELMQKMLTIYNQAHVVKYQLPGEDLDALVSVSCDEDLQNMMEEFNLLEDRGSQKLRMFLFSGSDLDDSQLGLGSVEGDSEIQYVVAVNGMDLGSRKNSIGIGSTSGNNLDELLNLNVERESEQVADELAGAVTSTLAASMPSSTSRSSQPVAPSSGNAYDPHSQAYHGQMLDHGRELYTLPSLQPRENLCNDGKSTVPSSVMLQYGYVSHPSIYAPLVENLVRTPLHVHMTGHQGSAQQQTYRGTPVQDPELSIKEDKVQRDSTVHKVSELEKNHSLGNEAFVKEAKMERESSSHAHDSSVPNHIPRDASDPQFSADIGAFSLPTEKHQKLEEPIRSAIPSGALNEGNLDNFTGNDNFNASGKSFAPVYGEFKTNSAEFSYLEQPVLPQRVFHSERIPREQAELNRLSKSDDSFDPQVLMSHARSDLSQQLAESGEKLHDGNVVSQSEQSSSSLNPLYMNPQNVEDVPRKPHKYSEVSGYVDKMNSKISEETSETKFQNSVLKPIVLAPVESHEMVRIVKNNRYQPDIDKDTSAMKNPVVRQGPSGKLQEDSTSRSQESHRDEITVKKNNGNNTDGDTQSFVQIDSPVIAPSQGASARVSNPEQGDILIDINDRFPPDFLSDIFSKARNSGDLVGISPLHADGTGLSLNMENHEPKRWSFFQKLVQSDFGRKDVSLMDQDHHGFSYPLTNIEDGTPIDYSFPPLKTEGVALGHMDSHINYKANFQPQPSGAVEPDTITLQTEDTPQFSGMESTQFDVMVKPRMLGSDIKDGNLEVQHALLVDLSVEEIDFSTLQIIKNEDLEELRELGSGTFGTVYHGKWRGTDVAIKRIKKTCFTGRSSEQERLTTEFWREADILSKLHHPNVVAFYGVVQDGPGGTLATVTEYMVNGSLRHVLVSKDRQLDRRKRLIIAMDAAFGMEYLHSKNIVHFDLKCDNLLVNLKDPSRPICKVGDFGLSKIKRNTLVTGGVRGTLPWMAPELLNGSSSKVSEKVDVFSFGIVLWEILTGEEPYANMHYGAIIGGIVNNTLRPHVPSYCDTEWKLLMEQCWAPDPVVRPSFTEIAGRLRVMSAACQTKPQGHQVTK